MMRLRTRMVLTYAGCLCAVVVVLSLAVQRFSGKLFAGFVQQNIQVQSEHIVDSVGRQFNAATGSFNPVGLMAIGMDFASQGFILSVEDTKGNILWDARQCDMSLCSSRMQEIMDRMAEHRLDSQMQVTQYPLIVEGRQLGYVNIETVGPFFYSEAESEFITSLNRLLLYGAAFFLLCTLGISVLLAANIAKPVRHASQAARKIADGDFSVRMDAGYRTTELHELAQSVNNLAEALENSQRWQKRLTSNIAHELRTPLTSLQGNIEALIDGVWAPTPERLLSCHEEIVRLGNLVEDLSEISLLEQENLLLSKSEFDIGGLCREVAAQLLPLAAEKGLTLVCPPGSALVSADPHKMKQVLVNLVSNAIRYTTEGTVTMAVSQTSAGLQLTVSDTGCGISQEDLPHIFERFYRADKSRNRDTGGAGIGLAIAKSIVEAHGGTIEAHSSGQGTVFTVLLPGDLCT